MTKNNLLFTKQDILDIIDNHNIQMKDVFEYLAGRKNGKTRAVQLFSQSIEKRLQDNFKKSMARKLGHATRAMNKMIESGEINDSQRYSYVKETHETLTGQPTYVKKIPETKIETPKPTIDQNEIEQFAKEIERIEDPINRPDRQPEINAAIVESKVESILSVEEEQDLLDDAIIKNISAKQLYAHWKEKGDYRGDYPPRPGDTYYDAYYMTGEYMKYRIILEHRQEEKEMERFKKSYEPSDYQITYTHINGLSYTNFHPIRIPPFTRSYAMTKELLRGEEQHPLWDEFSNEIPAIKKSLSATFSGKPLIGRINDMIESSSFTEDYHIRKYCEKYSFFNIPETEEERLELIKQYRKIKRNEQYGMSIGQEEGYAYDFRHKDFLKHVANAHDSSILEMQENLSPIQGHKFIDRFLLFLTEIENYSSKVDVSIPGESLGDYDFMPRQIPEYLQGKIIELDGGGTIELDDIPEI